MSESKHAALSTINQAAAVLGAVAIYNLSNSALSGEEIQLSQEQALNVIQLFGAIYIMARRTLKEHKSLHFWG